MKVVVTLHSLMDTVHSFISELLTNADCKLPEGVKMVTQGENISLEVTLLSTIAMEKGLRFAIREGTYSICGGLLRLLNNNLLE
jgi:translation elongation factor EF-Tu-like GTPase